MQMTESFAATVAAVAPVIVLVGVVEVDQHRKILNESLTANSEELRAALEPLPREPTREQVEAVRARFEALLPEARRRTKRLVRTYFLAIAWLVVVFALVSVEAVALGWLAKPEGKPETGQAVYCLTTLIIGMFCVATPAMFRLLRAPIEPLDQRAREWRRLERLEQDLSARQEV
ncbi:hypothetical protein [Streptomyces sp. NPDC051218]|uniref:hypothetical protein n=1 Tax=Streptomyces sp. NPDC051218 TaxID=3365645 RepID=UPI00379A1A20